MALSKNIRVLENGLHLNIGSLHPNQKLITKAKEEFAVATSDDVHHSVKQILRQGTFQKDPTTDHQFVICLNHKCVTLDQTLKRVVNLYSNQGPVPKQKTAKIKIYSMDDFLPDNLLTNALDAMSSEVNRVEDYVTELRNSLSTVDKGISEIYHDIEMTNLSASKGYLFAKNLQILLRERRRIKNTLKQTSSIQAEVNTIKKSIHQWTNKLQKI